MRSAGVKDLFAFFGAEFADFLDAFLAGCFFGGGNFFLAVFTGSSCGSSSSSSSSSPSSGEVSSVSSSPSFSPVPSVSSFCGSFFGSGVPVFLAAASDTLICRQIMKNKIFN